MRPLHRAFALAALAALIAAAPVSPLEPVDAEARSWLGRAAVAAGGAYATVRVLNASVSVLKESHLSLEPAGLGVSLAVGQLLDPLDDMTERLSDVIVLAIVALGAQRVLHDLGAELAPGAVAALLALLAGLALAGPRAEPARRAARLLLLTVLAARLAAPIAALGGAWIEARFISPQVEVARADLRAGVDELEGLTSLELPEEAGLLGTVSNAGRLVRDKLAAFRAALERSRGRLDEVVDALLRLTAAFTAQVVVNGVLLPLGCFAALWVLGRGALRAFAAGRPLEREAPPANGPA